MACAGGSSDEETQNIENRERSCTRLNSTQIERLEKFYNDCQYPQDAQHRELAVEVGLSPEQVKHWFQNKRSRLKTLGARVDSDALQVENVRLQKENLIYKKELKKVICRVCGAQPFLQEEHELLMQKMRLENAELIDKFEKENSYLRSIIESQLSQQEVQQGIIIPIIGSSQDAAPGSGIGSSSLGMGDNGVSLQNNPMDESVDFHNQKKHMKEIVCFASVELAKLIRYNQPFWFLSPTDGKFTLHLENYEVAFPKNNHLIGPNVRVESFKDSVKVNIKAMQLVEMFLHPVKWRNLFPTIVTKAETVKVFDNGLTENRNGALLLMYEEIHVLSPSVQPRKFHFLRYCEHVHDGLWMITDVSVDPSGHNYPVSRSWKHPSGCRIQEMPDGSCTVVWVEHVEVDEIQGHHLFRDLVDTNIAYGAQRWMKELQRTCERFACFSIENISNHGPRGGVIQSVEGKRSMMKISLQMVKIFCESLTMSGQEVNYPHPTMEDSSRVKLCARKITEMGHTNVAVIVAATTLWLPLHYHKIFEFFTDTTQRPQWDVLLGDSSMHELGHISTGANPCNYVSIIQPFVPNIENNAVILQESFMDPMGSYVIYAPIDVADMDVALSGGDTLMTPIIPSGFVISADGQENSESSGGSLLTVAFQMLVGCSLAPDGTLVLNMEHVAYINNVFNATIQKIQSALKFY